MLYRESIGPFGVFERIRDVDPVFINHIKELFQKPIELTDEEQSLGGIKDVYPEEETSVEAIENRIWGRQKGMNPVTIIGRAWTNNSKSNYVLYPYGTTAGDCPSRFLGICIGETRLEDVMNAAMDFSAIVANKYRWKDNDRKTVVIITDKWNQKKFNHAYEEQMLAHAVNDGIWYLILFVNQFDIEQIPFLPNDRSSIHGVTW